MSSQWKILKGQFKFLLPAFALLVAACSTNPATGQRQFAALMSPAQEVQVGAQEHEKIKQQFGLVKDKALVDYVNMVGQKVTADTERPDVQYKFFVLDSPIVNAFAVPGGYIYISRGLLALADNEAEMASVLGHEAGHITGRHSAERYSHGVVTSLGAGLLSSVLGSQGASQALGLGSNLYLSSYSRGQENEADTLGLRYMTRAGYDPQAVPDFLYALQRQSALDAALDGRKNKGVPSYFSTHPATAERVNKTRGESAAFKQGGKKNRDRYLKAINGMIYGDSPSQGFAIDQTFYHPEMNFKFSVPEGFKIKNQPTQVAARAQNGAVILFDIVGNKAQQNARSYITQSWLKDRPGLKTENITVNGLRGATTAFAGTINGQAMTIRLVAIEWKGRFARFQMAIPRNSSNALVEELKRTTYSFGSLNEKDRARAKPMRLRLYTAKAGDSVASIARRMPFDQLQEERFRVLNAMGEREGLKVGQVYKIITQ